MLALLLFAGLMHADLRLHVVTKKLNSPSKQARLPVLLVMGGFQTSERVIEMVHTEEPLLVASFEYPYQEKPELGFFAKLAEIPKIKAAIHQTETDICHLIRQLVERPDVDDRRITLAAGSFGAPFAIVSAARSSVVSGLVVIHGFSEIAPTMQAQFENAWEIRPHLLNQALAFLLSRLATWYIDFPDPTEAATQLRANQRVLVITSKQDEFIPAAVTEEMWTAFERSAARISRRDLVGEHELRLGEPALARISQEIVTWMKGNRLLLPSDRAKSKMDVQPKRKAPPQP